MVCEQSFWLALLKSINLIAIDVIWVRIINENMGCKYFFRGLLDT